jgi:hypothetical protein
MVLLITAIQLLQTIRSEARGSRIYADILALGQGWAGRVCPGDPNIKGILEELV